MTTEILQLCPLIPALEEELAQRFTVHRLFEAADKAAFLAKHGGAIRGVVTGGHIGLPGILVLRSPALKLSPLMGWVSTRLIWLKPENGGFMFPIRPTC